MHVYKMKNMEYFMTSQVSVRIPILLLKPSKITPTITRKI